MSAEREAFKEIDRLVHLKKTTNDYVLQHGRLMVKSALREFFAEHQDVKCLKWTQDFDSPEIFISDFQALVGAGYKTALGLQSYDIKLSKCLEAMQEKFTAIKEVLDAMFGTRDVIIFPEVNID